MLYIKRSDLFRSIILNPELPQSIKDTVLLSVGKAKSINIVTCDKCFYRGTVHCPMQRRPTDPGFFCARGVRDPGAPSQ